MDGRKGLITSSRRNGDLNEYVVFDGEKYHRFTTKKRIRGRSVLIRGNDLEELKESVMEEVKKRFFSRVRFEGSLPEDLSFLRESVERVWKEIAFLKIVGETPQVFYDPDADGMISALLFTEVLRANLKPLNPWNLEMGSSLYPDLRAPSYFLLDLGSSPDTQAGVKFLSSLKPLIIIDHHYSPETPPGAVINPALRDPSLSKFFTAYLVQLVLQTWIKKDNWVRIAAAGDRSPIVEWTEKDRQRAIALEMSPEVFGYNSSIWRSILETDLYKPLYDLFLSRVEIIEENAEKEEYEINGMKILHLRYPYPGFHYPHRGKVGSYYQEKGNYDIVVVEESDREKLYSVSLRSKRDLFPFLEDIKRQGLGVGWGHPNAITIKTRDPSRIVEELRGYLNEG